MNYVQLADIPETLVIDRGWPQEITINPRGRLLAFLVGSCCPVGGIWNWDLEGWAIYEGIPEIKILVDNLISHKEVTAKSRLRYNTVLFTKNGMKIGNGIIVEIFYHEGLKTILYKVATDYGNIVKISEKEVQELFYIGKRSNKGHKYYVNKKERHRLSHIEKE